MIYAGKAHPQDQSGKEAIQRIYQARDVLKKEIKIAYLENYDIDLGKMITSGVDIWLNTPPTTPRSIGDKWDEGRPERCAESEHPGWLVD